MPQCLIVFLLFAAIVTGCASDAVVLPKATIEEDLRIYVKEVFNKEDSSYTLDSIRLISLDTIWEKDRLNIINNELVEKYNELSDQFNDYEESARLNVKLAKLAGMASSSLFDHYKDEAKEDAVKLQNLAEEMKAIEKSSDSVIKLRDIADSIKLINYEAVFIYQLTRKDRSIKRDTGYVMLNTDYRIIRKEDYK